MSENALLRRLWCNRTVLALSATSFFSDVSHEMGTAVLPLFLKSLAGGAAALGLIEGVAELLMALGKLYGGVIGDRMRSRKWATGFGYLLTTIGIGSYALAGAWWQILIGRSVAWFGRGYRGPLRDALMADAADPKDYGKAFGLERAGDYAGAFAGPLVSAFLLWRLLPLNADLGQVQHVLRSILGLVVIPGVIASLLVWLLVKEIPHVAQEAQRRLFRRVGEMPRGFMRFLLAMGLFSLGDFSNTMLILWAAGSSWVSAVHEQKLAPILLYAGYNAVGTVVAYVSGHLSDTLGRRGLLIGGYTGAVIAAFLIATGSTSLGIMVVVFALNGIAMGNKEAVEKAFAADFLAPHERALGFGTLALVNGIGKLLASSIVGVLWSVYGVTVAFGAAGMMSLIGVVLLAVLTRPGQLPATQR